jgi:hypothetical protein
VGRVLQKAMRQLQIKEMPPVAPVGWTAAFVCSVRHQTVKFHVIFVNTSGHNTLVNVSQRSKSTLQDTSGRLFPEREMSCFDTTGVFLAR